MSGKKKQTKEQKIRSLTQRLLNLDAHADKLAVQSKFQELAVVNAQMDDLADDLAKLGVYDTDAALAAAKASGMKPSVIKSVSSKKPKHGVPWYDDDDPGFMDTGYKGYGGYSQASASKPLPKCAHSHPLLSVEGKDGVTLDIQGGSCYSPQGDFDVEIMLCSGATLPSKMLPWSSIQFVRYPIVDMQAPADQEEFDRLIDWTIEQMRAGKKVHVGCIGGHGRTGTFLSVLVHKISGRTDATTWLRENYCKKAVESQTQVDWLFKHYGIEKVAPTKTYKPYKAEAKTKGDRDKVAQLSFTGGSGTSAFTHSSKSHEFEHSAVPVPGKSIWGSTQIV